MVVDIASGESAVRHIVKQMTMADDQRTMAMLEASYVGERRHPEGGQSGSRRAGRQGACVTESLNLEMAEELKTSQSGIYRSQPGHFRHRLHSELLTLCKRGTDCFGG